MRDLATYDYRGLGKAVRPKLEADGRGWRAIAPDIGVTITDLSRLSAGQPVAAHKVIAVCDWAKLDPRTFYHPAGLTGPSADVSRRVFHGARTETGREEVAQ